MNTTVQYQSFIHVTFQTGRMSEITATAAFLTQSSGYCQEGDLVNDGASADWTVVTQPRPLPDYTVHSGFLDHTVGRSRCSQSLPLKSRNFARFKKPISDTCG